jgi:hypothetical protein
MYLGHLSRTGLTVFMYQLPSTFDPHIQQERGVVRKAVNDVYPLL